MDKNIIKVIVLSVSLLLVVAAIVFVALKTVDVGIFEIVSVADIGAKKENVEQAKTVFEQAKQSYEGSMTSLEKSKKEFESQKQKYENISDEQINAIKSATKEQEYFIEYLWINLGNYATAHDLGLAIIEPGGKIDAEKKEEDKEQTEEKNALEETNADNTNTQNAAASGALTSGAKELTVQVKGSYMDLADFVFEVENDRELRFRLDNIKMTSAGGTDVVASFVVKDFTVLRSLKK